MTYLLYALGVLWVVGCVLLALKVTISIAEDGVVPAIIAGCIGFPLAILFAMIPWAIAASESSPDLVTLKKGQWICSASHVETSLTPISTGKTTTLVPTSHSVCDIYSRTN